ncbi:hypothetical protein BSK63_17565 [Paenibacillus odorifer]|uniref:hypothetical protein n=1 Tax=Paenibacillus odorifer TaxID=189426 RepID=UPI00096D4715|nr:hypothetical protein [Paenibacillus odorifer]OME30701.1 hypothetical protein BSK63_17565 [Paenibacillus odorifer]
MRKTDAQRGKAAAFKLREDEEELVLLWINAQSVYGDSMRYLIQKDIAENGIRNLQQFVPRSRDIESIKRQLMENNTNQSGLKPIELPSVENENKGNNNNNNFTVGSEIDKNKDSDSFIKDTNLSEPDNTHSTNTEIENRPAGKTFSNDVISSYQS